MTHPTTITAHAWCAEDLYLGNASTLSLHKISPSSLSQIASNDTAHDDGLSLESMLDACLI
ncbi:unnamed protein product [Sphenostylis stenocarpa]|uniref:Uncharacterized protein n=1 Tax=Sphenostylis stenocarpa TaxID=92480 RepID=A0AA86T291_9FABA|nr:unnamed protein product [Sphenostylis stenocarpa]